MSVTHRRAVRRSLACVALIAVMAAAGCTGRATAPTGITSTSATLHAMTECVADTTTNPCTGGVQYWADSSTTVLTTPRVTVNARTGPIDFNQTVTGLTPDTLYHVQFCGYGDSNVAQPGLCI